MVKNNFIRLHNSNDNSVIIINIDHIVMVDSDTSKEKLTGLVYMDNNTGIDEFNVNETPEKIYGMIEEMTNK